LNHNLNIDEKKLKELVEKTLGATRPLSSEPCNVLNREFAFGDTEHYVVGTITSVGYGPEEGVSLRVSAPRFRSMDILFLKKKDDAWIAVGHNPDETKDGTFALL